MRLGKTQKHIIQYLKDSGGKHVYIGATSGKGCLAGYYLEEVERSLAALVRRKIVIEDKPGFYTLPENK